MIKFFTVIFGGLCLLYQITCGQSNYQTTNPIKETSRITYFKENPYDIAYTIEPFYDLNKIRFIVVMELFGDKSGETQIKFPGEFGGENNSKGIKFLKTLSENTLIYDTDKPDIKIVKHPPGFPIKIYYQVEEIRDEEIELGNHYLVTINRRYFHFLGETFFIVPHWDFNTEIKFRIFWNHMPSNWNLANSFGVNNKVQDFKTSISQFISSVFTGGDFRILKRTIGNNSVLLSIRGKWKFSDDQIIELTKDVLKAERDFWKDHNFPFFMLSLIPISGNDDQGGIGRTNSFSMFLSDDRLIDYRLKRLIAHEAFHTWLGNKMHFAEPEQLVYWFKEGFCDYYARLILLRAKLITLNDYVDEYNKILYAYGTSPARYEKNERVVNEFWSDQNIMKLPYMRGDIFAHNLNASIRKYSNGTKSLDDMMRDLYKRSQNESLLISNGSLSALIRYYAGEQALSEIMRTLNSGESLKANPDALGPCFKMEIDSFRKYKFIGELFDVPVYKPKIEDSPFEKKCLEWFLEN